MIFQSIQDNNLGYLLDYIEQEGNLNIKNDRGDTLLEYAIKNGNLGITLLLIECGIQYEVDKLISFADRNNQVDIARALRIII